MSDGLKTGLILGGAGLVAFFIWKNSQSAAVAVAGAAGTLGVPTVPGTGSVLSMAPGSTAAPPPPPPASSGAKPSTSALVGKAVSKGVTTAIEAPIVIGKTLVGGVLSGIKSIF